MANGNGWTVPSAPIAWGVFFLNAILAITGGSLLCALFGPWFLDWGWYWGVVLTLVVLAFSVEIYTETVPGYFARILLNPWTRNQRTIFQGLSFKLPWESRTIDVDLKSELSDVCEETWATKGGAMMDTKYVYLLRPARNPDAIITYASFEPNVVKRAARNLLTMMYSDYFGQHQPEDLLNKAAINKALFNEEKDGGDKDYADHRAMVCEFENKYGVDLSARIEDVDYDEATQKARDIITNAKSFDQAVDILMAPRNGQPGMSRENAEKVAKLANFPNVSENNWNFSVEGLDNLQHLNIVGIPDGKSGKK
ncbi:MAG: SPFH domain-containing protein [Candidatus Pacebacteria bacterium]|nr:SPFH domain-containing protein [Candidatus Paceibacterota bacterium]